MACRDLEFLWKEYFRDPSQFQDHRSSKRGPRSPDFRHKQTREPLWIDAWHNPLWVKEELRRSRLQYGECHLQKAPGKHKVLKVRQEFQDHTALFDSIKACGNRRDLLNGSKIHADILERGLFEKDISLANALVSMYAKCGA
eukprot:c17427_g4_i1 orf=260-685(+)